MQPPGGSAPDNQPSGTSSDLPDQRERRPSPDTGAAQPTRPLMPLRPLATRANPPAAPSGQPSRRARERRDSRQARSSAPPHPGAAVPPPPVPAGLPARRPPRRDASSSGLYLPWWSLVMMVAVVGAMTLVLVLTFSALAEPNTPGDQVPRVQVITPQPTLSQDFLGGAGQEQTDSQGLWPTPIRAAQPTATMALPTPVPSPSLPPGNPTIGVLVKVVGVGSSGLNIRSSPGLGGTPRFLAAEEAIFVVVEGPQSADGLEWWRLEDPDDPQRYGWAARNYLEVVSG